MSEVAEYKNRGKWSDIQVHLNNHCEHRCEHCYTKSTSDETGCMPDSIFQAVVDFAAAASNRVLRMLGGEIVTDDLDLLPYLRYARKRLDRIIICTNGFYSDPWMRGMIDPADFMEIIVSCYGFKEAHEALTHMEMSFERTYRTIGWLAAQTERTYELTVNTVTTSYNSDEFIDFVRDLVALGVDEIKVLSLSPLGMAAQDNGRVYDRLRVTPEVRRDLRSKCASVFTLSAATRTRIIWEPTDIDSGHSGIASCKLDQETMVTVDKSGFVYPCHLLIGQPRFAVGRISGKTSSLEAVLRAYDLRGSYSSLVGRGDVSRQGCPAYWDSVQCDSHIPSGGSASCPLYLERLVE